MKFCSLLSLTVLALNTGTLPAQYTEGIAVREARDKAWTPEREQKGIELDGPYEAQLVASEPLIFDPVEMTWDAKGRCFVADMRDYPLGPPEGQKPLSRIVQLLNPDKNGRYTKSKIFAEHVDHVQGLLPYKDGLIATTRTQILFLRDTDGDGVADEIKPLVEGFNPSHSQLQVSAPRWGLDNCVYFNNGINAAEVYPTVNPAEKVKIARCNLRWDPATGKIEPTTGFGQYGGCFDDWGRHFFCSNRNPVMFAVMPYEAVVRNPHAGITQGWEDIAPTGADAKVYPLQLTHTTADAHAGTHTAACGLGVYRGDLMPELRGEIFVCEPTAQAVVRYHIEPNGASLKATRVGDHKEFFRSRDEWTRPVNVTTGPDGALYICDIYRRFIDHARFFPEAFVKSHDMRAGEHEGRIWRVVPRGTTRSDGFQPSGKSDGKMPSLRAIEPAPQKVEELVAWLGHKNAWQRETAQRLLVEMKDNLSLASLKSPTRQFVITAAKGGFKGTIPFEVLKPAIITNDNTLMKLHGERVFDAWVGSSWWNSYAPSKMQGRMDSAEAQMIHFMWIDEASKMRSAHADINSFLWFQESHEAFPIIITPHGPNVDSNLAKPASEMRWAFLNCVTNYDGAPSSVGTPLDHAGKRFELLGGDPTDDWFLKAVLSASTETSGRVLQTAVSSGRLPAKYFTQWADNIRELTVSSVTNAKPDDFPRVFDLLKRDPGKLHWWKPALLQGLAEGLPKSGKKLGISTLAELTAKPPAQFKEAAAEITLLLAQVDAVMTDPAAPLENRLAVIPLLAQRTWDKAEPIMRSLLLADNQNAEITAAALAVLRKFSTDKSASLLYELLPRLSPAPRREVVAMLSAGKMTMDFLQRMERGEISKALVGTEQRWGFQHSGKPEIKELAAKLFGTVSSDRAAVINAYMDAAKKKGNPQKGHQVFQTICITCHRIRGEGVEVGPDITDVRIKPVDALLTDILDPNRIVEPRFMAYQVDTKDGRVVSGIMSAENSDSVTLKLAGGVTEAVPRSNVKAMKCLDQSLMPVGVEATISKEQMADLLAFLRGE